MLLMIAGIINNKNHKNKNTETKNVTKILLIN